MEAIDADWSLVLNSEVAVVLLHVHVVVQTAVVFYRWLLFVGLMQYLSLTLVGQVEV